LGTHNLILNKFNVVPYHLLLTTIDFQDQNDLISKNDFKAL